MTKNNLTKKEVEKDLSDYKAIEAIANQQGGKKIIAKCLATVTHNIDNIASNYKEKSHIELIELCAELKSNLDMLRVFKNAKTNIELAEEALEDIEE